MVFLGSRRTWARTARPAESGRRLTFEEYSFNTPMATALRHPSFPLRHPAFPLALWPSACTLDAVTSAETPAYSRFNRCWARSPMLTGIKDRILYPIWYKWFLPKRACMFVCVCVCLCVCVCVGVCAHAQLQTAHVTHCQTDATCCLELDLSYIVLNIFLPLYPHQKWLVLSLVIPFISWSKIIEINTKMQMYH